MRDADLNRLGRPYPVAARDRPREQLWADAVGIEVPHLRALVREVNNDLDEKAFGVRWWNPQVDTRRRILIGDYLFQCTKSLEINLVEASLHRLEALDALERAERATKVILTPRGPTVVHEPPISAAADIHVPLADMHIAGFSRAIGSALDCLGGSIVGVLALPRNIIKTSYMDAKRALDAVTSEDDGARLQVSFRSTLQHLEAECGPTNWLTWALDHRHALVHRARRLLAVQITSRSGLLDSRGQPLTRTIHHLPRDPAFSEIDMWRDADQADALSEDASTTMSGVLTSTVTLVESATIELARFWKVRREAPNTLVQPGAKQWPDDSRPTPTGFSGYSPGEWPYSPAALVSSGEVLHRITAAALPDSTRKLVW